MGGTVTMTIFSIQHARQGLTEVERISDDDPALLQFFEDRGIVLGAHLTVREGAPFSESIDVHVRGEDQPVALGRVALDALYVSRG